MGIWGSLKQYYKRCTEGSCHVLSVLMWKHFVEHKHCWSDVLLRVIQGCSVFFALLTVRMTVLSIGNHPEEVRRHDSSKVNKILFSPHNTMTEIIMENVKNELNWMNFVSEKLDFDFYNDTTVLNDSSEIITMVDFKDFGTKTNTFTYFITTLIKEPKIAREKSFQKFFHELQPSDKDVTTILGLLQWAIDKSYIEHLGNRRVLHELRLYHRESHLPHYMPALHRFIPLCIVIAPLPFFLHKSSKLCISKRIGFQNLIRLSGVSSNIYRISHLLFTILSSSIYAVLITFILKVTSHPILPYSNPVIITISIILYFLTINCIAFVTSTISSDYQYANSMAMLVYVGTFLVSFKWFTQNWTTETARILVCCFLPHTPIFIFWDKVMYMESFGKGVQFSEINEMHSYHLPITVIWLVFFLQLLSLLLLDWYLDQVIPSQFGVTQKWNFIFKRRNLSPKKKKIVNFHVTAEQNVRLLRDSRYFEELPSNAEVAVKIINLTKVYKSKSRIVVALDKVSLDVYKGEVTVLLGNHDSGKSTLMCIISGMQSPTSGTVYVNGMDNVLRLREIQHIVSFCPQEIILYRYLTVRENIMFFEKLKKSPQPSIIDELITQLQLSEHKNLLSDQLSRGMRRCVQVACSIASGEDVLVFDEPTSNMGIEARHRVWELIMKLRGQKTIIMSTSILEEASALGDRIAILNKGKVRCYGSSSFLSDAIGIGLNLTITLNQPTYLEALQNLVEDAIRDVKCQIRGTRCMTFMLPQKKRDLFINLIDTLEAKKKEFTISTIDVGVSMEAVYAEFMDQFADDEVVEGSEFGGATMEKYDNWRVVLTQFMILIKRVYHYVWMKKFQFIFMQVVLPILGLFLVTFTTNSRYGYGKFVVVRANIDTVVFNPGHYRRNAFNDVVGRFGIYPLYSKDVEKDLDHVSTLPERTIGLEISKRMTKMYIPPDPYALSKSVNMFSNMFIKLHMPMTNKTIVTTYESKKRAQDVIEPKPLFLCLNWSVWVSFLSMLTLAPFIMLAIMERQSGTRDIHIMAGCSSLVHWCSKFVAHMSIYTAIVPLAVLLIALFLDFDETFTHGEFLGALLLILILFASAFLMHLQFLSFILDDYLAIGQIYFMSLGFGIIVPVFMLVLDFQASLNERLRIIYIVILILVYFSPLYVFSTGLFHLVGRARLNTYCFLNKHLCPNLVLEEEFPTEICCNSSANIPFGYFDSVLRLDVAVLIIHSFLYLIIVILLEKRIIQYWVERIIFYKYKRPQQRHLHLAIEREKAVVRDRFLIKQFGNEALIARKLYKTYYRFRNHLQADNAVQGITFLAKKGECIGILGPTGAGKSTLLKMLAGCVTMTRGDSWVAGYHIRSDRTKYLRKIGLVTSTGAVDGFYTGRENLILICQLAGYSKLAAERLTAMILQDLGIYSYANILVEKYSTSCWHRLLLCIVRVLDPAVAFIDQPLMDVDHTTRAIIARALARLVAGGTTVIVAETSLDWYQMESVYDRIAILYGGQMAAIGPAGDIVRELTSGYSVHIKLKVDRVYWTSQTTLPETTIDAERASAIQALKDDFHAEFVNSVVTQENVCMLFFYIKDEERILSYNELYSKLHKLIDKHRNILESYTFNKTTIEEIFWRIPYLIDQL